MPLFKRSASAAPTRTASARSGRALNLPIILGFVLVVAVFVGMFALASGLNKSYKYYVATNDIVAGTILPADPVAAGLMKMLDGSGSAPGNYLLDDKSLADVIGKRVIETIPLGAMVERSSFFVPNDRSKASPDPNNPDAAQRYTVLFSEILPANARAVVLQGDPTSSYVRAGDLVDVYYVVNSTVRRIFAGKQVLYAIPQADPTSVGGAPSGTTLILNLSAQEAQNLVYAQETGVIRIGLGSPDSVNTPSTVTQTNQQFFDQTYGTVSTPASPAPAESASPAPGESGTPVATPSPTACTTIPGAPCPSTTP